LSPTTSLKFLSALKSPGLGPTWHIYRRVADKATKAETALSGSVSYKLMFSALGVVKTEGAQGASHQ